MPQSLSNILVPFIFSTKNRQGLIDESIETELHKYLCTVWREANCPLIAIGGTSDHIHALGILGRQTNVADIIEEVKTSSSKWIKSKGRQFSQFYWQAGYGAFSIGESGKKSLMRYIAGQKDHHKKVSFQDEYRKFLRAYGIDFDERYVWD